MRPKAKVAKGAPHVEGICEFVENQDAAGAKNRVKGRKRVEGEEKQISVIVDRQPGARSEILQVRAQGFVESTLHKLDAWVVGLWDDAAERHRAFLDHAGDTNPRECLQRLGAGERT